MNLRNYHAWEKSRRTSEWVLLVYVIFSSLINYVNYYRYTNFISKISAVMLFWYSILFALQVHYVGRASLAFSGGLAGDAAKLAAFFQLTVWFIILVLVFLFS